MNKEVQSSLQLDSTRNPKTLNVKNYNLAFFFSISHWTMLLKIFISYYKTNLLKMIVNRDINIFKMILFIQNSFLHFSIKKLKII